ncbi:MAG: heparinase II/III-family protein [Gemmatimonadota bacterium]|nr:heparinase II/III-family protein [Gemmatimonadota bacterium]
MSLLASADALRARRAIAHGALAELARGLRAELAPVLRMPLEVPTEKALLSRAGGRCDRDGTYLAYDPFDPRHRCPHCGRELTGEQHDRFRLYWHQLWLAERTVHAALLGALLDDAAARSLAIRLLDAYAAQYLRYPNSDNVLGPSRPFFSTYLESIWLLQLTIALDLLESSGDSAEMGALGARVRAELITPSAALIGSYDEGMSNRQVWNNAALIAAGTLLGDRAMIERAVTGPSGLHEHLGEALLADGSWYEGENYHLFAHRGLWYAVQMAEQGGHELPAPLAARFRDGFVAPFRTLLPDLTYPSRRDSQYAVSVRQPRFAESCELGLARGDDARLVGVLARLYERDVPRGATGRATSSADVERNQPATGLTRADLSWRTLLLARPELPPLVPVPLVSDLLPAQGIGILRRDRGALYVALDYGHSGGGHGHPDRLNLLLVDGSDRWFDDPGTGSYVDPSLHWYRSTLAHTAPLADGRSQQRVNGDLAAFEDAGVAGWVSAVAELLPGMSVSRTIVVLEDYLVDLLQWESDTPHELAMPLHGVDIVDENGTALAREPMAIEGGDGIEDGFSFLRAGARIAPVASRVVRLLGTKGGRRLNGWMATAEGTSWWSASAPDVPTRQGVVPLLLARHSASRGSFVSAWSWRDAIGGIEVQSDALIVQRRDGGRDVHSAAPRGWRIMRERPGTAPAVNIVLGGLVDSSRSGRAAPARTPPAHADGKRLPYTAALGEPHYRRSEQSWTEAGEPRAVVRIAAVAASTLQIDVEVAPSHRIFSPPDAANPLDNEPAGINGDGVQLYVQAGERSGGWLLVPALDSHDVTVHGIEGWSDHDVTVAATWREIPSGWSLSVRVELPPGSTDVALDVIVNEIAPGRARRRGQLVLSGADREFIYLRGDRHDRARLLNFTLPDA